MNSNNNIDNTNIIYDPEKLAYHLLLNNENMENLSTQIFSIENTTNNNKNNNKNIKEQLIYKFEILLNISFELIFKYIELLNKINNSNENLNKYSINDIENLLKPRLLKISILTYINEIQEISPNNNYCRVVIKDLCDHIDNNKFFININNKKPFHFILNANFNIDKINNLKDIYTIIEIQNKYYKISFDNMARNNH